MLKNLTPFFKDMTIHNATLRIASSGLPRAGRKSSPKLLPTKLNALHAIFSFAIEQGLVLSNPARRIKRRKIVQAQITVPTREQFQTLVATIRPFDGCKDSQQKARSGADLVERLA